MKTLLSLTLLVSLGILCSCSTPPPITQANDYQPYLTKQTNVNATKPVKTWDFWQRKYKEQPQNLIYQGKIAGLLRQNFRLTGNIASLHQADSIYHHILKSTYVPKAGTYLALAQNSITQHKFQQALKYAQKAQKIGGQAFESQLLMIDIYLELGYDLNVTSMLQSIENKNTFDYLIRASKFKDHQGNLEEAILLMEKAFERIKNNGKELYCWSLANLGDMYMHANRPRDAYQAYLKVLKTNPSYDHALKGIAWLAYVYDKNIAEAKRIIHFLQQQKTAPDLYLLLAELADFEGNSVAKQKNLQKFMAITSQDNYGAMYDTYRIALEAEEFKNYPKAIQLAKKEIKNRPIPGSYDLLAWALLQKGKPQEAYKIIQQQVTPKAEGLEPHILYHLGEIYWANNQPKYARKYLKMAEEGAQELGLVTHRRIKVLLQQI